MFKEIRSAVDFICSMLTRRIDIALVQTFGQALEGNLMLRYSDHWFPNKPFKGSAFRCIRIVRGELDKDIAKAWLTCYPDTSNLFALMPNDLTIWVDPNEVSYRFGEDGSIGILYSIDQDESSQLSDSGSSCSSVEASDNNSSCSEFSFTGNPSQQQTGSFQPFPMLQPNGSVQFVLALA